MYFSNCMHKLNKMLIVALAAKKEIPEGQPEEEITVPAATEDFAEPEISEPSVPWY